LLLHSMVFLGAPDDGCHFPTHVVDCFPEKSTERNFRWADWFREPERGLAAFYRQVRTLLCACRKIGSGLVMKYSSRDRVSRANESIPTPRHRAKQTETTINAVDVLQPHL
jgi:hypothetical protein